MEPTCWHRFFLARLAKWLSLNDLSKQTPRGIQKVYTRKKRKQQFLELYRVRSSDSQKQKGIQQMSSGAWAMNGGSYQQNKPDKKMSEKPGLLPTHVWNKAKNERTSLIPSSVHRELINMRTNMLFWWWSILLHICLVRQKTSKTFL